MYAREGHTFGDTWYFVRGEEAHLFCLTKPEGSKHGWDIGHLVSRDLRTWDDAGTALRRGAPGAWDDKGLATGSVIERDGIYWMAYTGHHSGDEHMVQRVGMAFSRDLHHWEKIEENPVSEAAPPHYELMSTGKRVMVHWRDPFLLADGERVLQFVCARRTHGDPTSRGTVGAAESRDMRRWTLLPPLEHDRMTEEMEVPQVYRIGGRCYLVFCTIAGDPRVPDMLSPSFTRRFPGHRFRRGDYSMVGRSPLGPFRIHGTGEIFARSPVTVYASQLVDFRGEWFLLGTEHAKGGARISDPYPVTADETGVHVTVSG